MSARIHIYRRNVCCFIYSFYDVWYLGGIRTLWTSSDCSAWVKNTAPLTSACASPISSGVETSTTDLIWMYRLAQQVEVNETKQNSNSENTDVLQDILKHVSKRAFDELMCADQLTRERHKRKAFLNFSEFQFTADVFFNKAIKITVIVEKMLMQKTEQMSHDSAASFACLTLCSLCLSW